jgi:hypothetical protein
MKRLEIRIQIYSSVQSLCSVAYQEAYTFKFTLFLEGISSFYQKMLNVYIVERVKISLFYIIARLLHSRSQELH